MTSGQNTKLTVDFDLSLGRLRLSVRFSLSQPWTVLFGPTGSGKTTTLRSIAGFSKPDAGKIVAAGKLMFSSEGRVFVPPHQRPIRSSAQGSRLFPHMTLRENIVFGSGRRPGSVSTNGIVEDVLLLFDLKEMRDRMPRDLSGGEAQKAVVARAVASAVTSPDHPILLLDEPFSGLDVRVRDDLLVRLRNRLAEWKIPVLSVTHDIAEAFQLQAEVIKIADGRVVMQGPVEIALAEERARLLAQLTKSERTLA